MERLVGGSSSNCYFKNLKYRGDRKITKLLLSSYSSLTLRGSNFESLFFKFFFSLLNFGTKFFYFLMLAISQRQSLINLYTDSILLRNSFSDSLDDFTTSSFSSSSNDSCQSLKYSTTTTASSSSSLASYSSISVSFQPNSEDELLQLVQYIEQLMTEGYCFSSRDPVLKQKQWLNCLAAWDNERLQARTTFQKRVFLHDSSRNKE